MDITAKININEFVRVKLTDHGKDIYEHHNDDLMKKVESDYVKEALKPIPLSYDDEGYTDFQLWNFMNIFGRHMFNGAEPVIEHNNIIFKGETNVY